MRSIGERIPSSSRNWNRILSHRSEEPHVVPVILDRESVDRLSNGDEMAKQNERMVQFGMRPCQGLIGPWKPDTVKNRRFVGQGISNRTPLLCQGCRDESNWMGKNLRLENRIFIGKQERDEYMKVRFYLIVGLLVVWVCRVSATPLDDYIAAPDSNYSYTLAKNISGFGYSATIWEMTSQAWRNPSEVDRTLWKHWVLVIVPSTVTNTKALMYIGAGDNGGAIPTAVDSTLLSAALLTKSIIAEVRMIPNQPIVFSDETDPRYVSSGRSEDELIAYGWAKYKESLDANQEDPVWLPQLPMTKAVVRAMDLVQTEYPSITGYMVAGASKRGWATWLTGAVDPRVEAIGPLVIDVPNVEVSLQHHWEAYGYWSDALSDYVDMGIMNWLNTSASQSMLDIIDPYSYRTRMTMPKFLVNSSGDQFFLPDSSQFYFNDLPGEKHLRYVPNTDHSLNTEAGYNLLVYYHSYLNHIARPSYSWTKEPDGSLHVQTSTTPTAVRLWQAANTTARNFRLDTIGATWTSSLLTDQGGGLYAGSVAEPAQGWRAFFVELEYPSGTLYPFKFTTEVSVVPDVLPFAPDPTPTPTESPSVVGAWSLMK